MEEAMTVKEQLEGSLALERAEEMTVPSPMSMIQMAVSNGAGMEVIKGLVQLQREERQYQAELEFNDAMQRAQSKMRRIGADANNPQTRSKYATYAKIDSAVRPIYTDEGFSLSFNSTESPVPDCMRVLCYASHKGGYTRTYQVDMPSDGKGAKGGDVMTKTHAAGAAMSYGMRYLLKMIFNVAVGETDDDGNGGKREEISTDEFDRLCGLIEAADTVEDLKSRYQSACRYAEKKGDEGAIREFEKRKNIRYREIPK
jgi:hypothetical protein